MPTLRPTIRVFVSSTFLDLKGERDILHAQVFPIVRRHCEEASVDFLPIDLRWGVSEAASVEQRTRTIIFEELRRCQLISPYFNFISLLGDRYGSIVFPESIPFTDFERILTKLTPIDQALALSWFRLDENAIPPIFRLQSREHRAYEWAAVSVRLREILMNAVNSSDVSNSTRNTILTSVTAQEVEAGIFQFNTIQHALCFARTIDSSSSLHPSMAQLRERLQGHLGARFVSYSANQLSDDVFSDFRTVVLDQLLMQVDQTTEQLHRAKTPVYLANTPEPGPYKDVRLDEFVGREDDLALLSAYLATPASYPLIVTGDSGVGKTTLLLKLAERAREEHESSAIISEFIGLSTSGSDIEYFLRYLYHRIAQAYGVDTAESTVAGDRAMLEAHVAAAIAQATSDRPLVLIVDAIDQLTGTEVGRWIPSVLPPYVHMIVSTLQEDEQANLRANSPSARVVEVKLLPVKQCISLFHHWLAEEERQLQPTQREYVEELITRNANPLYARLVFEEARRWPSYLINPPVLATTTEGIFQGFLTRLERPAEHGRVLVSRSLGYIAAGRTGLTEDELLDLLGEDQNALAEMTRLNPLSPSASTFPIVLWARMYSELTPYLLERNVNGSAVFDFYHRVLRDVVESRYLGDQQGILRHREIARYFSRQPIFRRGESAPADLSVNSRAAYELAYQQAKGMMSEDLRSTLTNASYMIGKILSTGTASVLDDLVYLSNEEQFHQLAQLLQVSAHVLDEHPFELRNQLFGRRRESWLMFHDIPSSGDLRLELQTETLLSSGSALVRINQAHSDAVNDIAVTEDGRYAISASSDKTVRVWDFHTWEQVAILAGHTAAVNAVSVTPTGDVIVSGSNDGTVSVWNWRSSRLPRVLLGHTDWVRSVVVSPDASFALSASDDRTIRMWNLSTGMTTRVLRGHSGGIYSIRLSENGRYAVSGSDDLTARIWDLERGVSIRELTGHLSPVTAVELSRDTQTIVTGSNGPLNPTTDSIRTWDFQTGDQHLAIASRFGGVNALAMTRDMHSFISGSSDQTVRLWDVLSGQQRQVLRGHSAPVLAVCLSADDRYALSASHDDSIMLWDLQAPVDAANQDKHEGTVNSIAFTADSQYVYSAGNDGNIKCWECASGHLQGTLRHHAGKVLSVAVGMNGDRIVSGGDDHLVCFWDVTNDKLVVKASAHSAPVTGVAIAASGQFAVSCSWDGTMVLWDVYTGTFLSRIAAHQRPINAIALAANGRFCFSASDDRMVRMWDLSTGSLVQSWSGHTDWILDVIATPDGRQLISASDQFDTSIRQWSLEATGKDSVWFSHQGAVTSLAVTADNRYVFSAGVDKTIRVRGIQTGEPATLFVADSPLTSLSLSRDSKVMAAGDTGGNIHILRCSGLGA